MPWRIETPMSQRLEFVEAFARGHWSMTELCARFGISRKTGYKWCARFEAEGAAFTERSRHPQESPTRLDGELAAQARQSPVSPRPPASRLRPERPGGTGRPGGGTHRRFVSLRCGCPGWFRGCPP